MDRGYDSHVAAKNALDSIAAAHASPLLCRLPRKRALERIALTIIASATMEAVLFGACPVTIAQGFQEIPAIATTACPAGYAGTSITPAAVSADGNVVVGGSLCAFPVDGSSPQTQAFRWTSSGGTVGLGLLPSFTVSSAAAGASADGSIIIGSSRSSTQAEGFLWTASGGMSGIGFPTGEVTNMANAVNADGSVVVGFRAPSDSNAVHAFRWTMASGFSDLGT